MKIFAQRLKFERLAKKLSQREMAKILQVPQSTYSHYEIEEGENSCEPSFEVAVRIANLLDTSLDYLFGRTDI